MDHKNDTKLFHLRQGYCIIRNAMNNALSKLCSERDVLMFCVVPQKSFVSQIWARKGSGAEQQRKKGGLKLDPINWKIPILNYKNWFNSIIRWQKSSKTYVRFELTTYWCSVSSHNHYSKESTRHRNALNSLKLKLISDSSISSLSSVTNQGHNQMIFNEMPIMSTLCITGKLEWNKMFQVSQDVRNCTVDRFLVCGGRRCRHNHRDRHTSECYH